MTVDTVWLDTRDDERVYQTGSSRLSLQPQSRNMGVMALFSR